MGPRFTRFTVALLTPWALLALTVLSGPTGCIMSDQQSSTDAGSDAGSSACDNRDSCNACLQCAEASACAEALNTCWNNAACVGIYQCFVACGVDTECRSQCLLSNPLGTDDYDAAADCEYCQQCPHDCAGYRSCS